ncbi:AAA domain-containing protein [Bartonella sp. F02]|uniref:AAA domain-containing protein n=1 Tax=Bartonella sp. F02 TaxID=2967262 RepID=UPI0022A8DE1B|nr:AAA domain-containing protein [Bartonella sp. F02]MCZ2328305.1 AAA domain-containing protein [Bartonella sp. F02]
MSLQIDRLEALIEFSYHSARLKQKPVASVSSHNIFTLYENDLFGLPGIKLNESDTNEDDEVWLSVERLQETKPPEVTNQYLEPWLLLFQDPNEEPTLKQSVCKRVLLGAEIYSDNENSELLVINSNETVNLEDYSERHEVLTLYEKYINEEWIPWANEEKKRRQTINIYSKLFNLKQILDGNISGGPIEFVWGIGFGILKTSETTVCYPLINQCVELSLDKGTGTFEVRPRNIPPRMELDWYATQDNPGVTELEKQAKEFFENLPSIFSPFDRNTYEILLRSAVTHLDSSGIYWPSQTSLNDRTHPPAEDKLKVTDTWVLFARPKTNSAYLQDLDRFKKEIETCKNILSVIPESAISEIFMDPIDENPEIEFSSFRGVSTSHYENRSVESHKSKDLYFPKPFNDEQVQIIQFLERFNGVVVQGPPGTGKTHTIANIICHYLAQGKKVLVTSMKDSALGVLTDQIPDEIRSLTIALLSNEEEGLKKFEQSINKIAFEIQNINRTAVSEEIKHLEESIDSFHGQLSCIDRDIFSWAKKNLDKIVIDSNELSPEEAAKELVNSQGTFECIPDPINITKNFKPKFNDQDICELRAMRSELRRDLMYLNASLPQLTEFPDEWSMCQIHEDLLQFEQLKREVENGEVPNLVDFSQNTIETVKILKDTINAWKNVHRTLHDTAYPWINAVKIQLCDPNKERVQYLLDELGEKLSAIKKQRESFLSRPVTISNNFETNSELVNAVKNLASGRKPFGFVGWIGKSEEKKILDSIQILGNFTKSIDDWKHVEEYIILQQSLRECTLVWNQLAKDLSLPILDETPQGGLNAIEIFTVYEDIKKELNFEQEIFQKVSTIFPSWVGIENETINLETLEELHKILQHHLKQSRLINVYTQQAQFQKILSEHNGPVVETIKDFFNQTLGNPAINKSEIQKKWSELMTELSRVLALRSKLDTVQKITDLICESGAPQYAALLREPFDNLAANDLLLSNWKKNWKLKRLDTYLNEIDAHEELKKLSKQRSDTEKALSNAYKNVIAKRTWLKFSENTSSRIRAALQNYLISIQKIGKGTGKRSIRYRQDARNAAHLASSAVPCWIMSHYRISESLPSELGYFDLVIIDEASQSDLTALPALLRAKKILIVGDDKQVAPESIGLEEDKIRNLMARFLKNQVELYRPQMSPDRSIYDLFKVVYAKSSVMLKEHFRCVEPIIEYSKREFYNHELKPLRLPKNSERLDPPLIDVFIKDGYRSGDENKVEARFIVEEIKRIVSDKHYMNRSIGVVSLLADKQARLIWDMLVKELDPRELERHKITCGDARTFQGKERDIIFLSMVVAPNNDIRALSGKMYEQRFNVAASRARDRMYLVRSVMIEDLSSKDILRRNLINHFSAPFAQDEDRKEDLRQLCESQFETEVYDVLTERGYWVTPQVKVGQFRIDMVVEGDNDSRIAIECDGDRYHGSDKWEEDMHRQRILERAGWVFWRCFASSWNRRKSEMIADLIQKLSDNGIEPIGFDRAPKSSHTEFRSVLVSELKKTEIITDNFLEENMNNYA